MYQKKNKNYIIFIWSAIWAGYSHKKQPQLQQCNQQAT